MGKNILLNQIYSIFPTYPMSFFLFPFGKKIHIALRLAHFSMNQPEYQSNFHLVLFLPQQELIHTETYKFACSC